MVEDGGGVGGGGDDGDGAGGEGGAGDGGVGVGNGHPVQKLTKILCRSKEHANL